VRHYSIHLARSVRRRCYNAALGGVAGDAAELQMNDVLRLRKPHPCGNTDWVVVRLGADIG
jgi:hypothetical protein